MPCRARYERGETISERHVQAVWYDRDIRPRDLFTRRGEAVRVVDPGKWNLEAGPDFLDAVVEVGPERRRLKGDVEIHLSPSDWDLHGHGVDPAYKNVVVHVTWGCGPDPSTLPSGAVTIWLGRFMTANPGFTPEQIDLSAYPFARLPANERPCYARLKSDPDLAREVLSTAGGHRIAVKSERISRILALRPHERNQVLYEEVMNALGYKRNSSAFRRIAEIVPYAALVAEPDNAEAALLTASSFMDWNRAGLRPRNFPEVRLAAAARLFGTRNVGCITETDDFSPRALRRMVEFLSAEHVMGRGRAAAVIANVIVPFAIAEGRTPCVPEWLPPEDLSEPVRVTAFRMMGRDHNPAMYSGNDRLVQGLIQVHREWCLRVHPECEGCGLVGMLEKRRKIC